LVWLSVCFWRCLRRNLQSDVYLSLVWLEIFPEQLEFRMRFLLAELVRLKVSYLFFDVAWLLMRRCFAVNNLQVKDR